MELKKNIENPIEAQQWAVMCWYERRLTSGQVKIGQIHMTRFIILGILHQIFALINNFIKHSPWKHENSGDGRCEELSFGLR